MSLDSVVPFLPSKPKKIESGKEGNMTRTFIVYLSVTNYNKLGFIWCKLNKLCSTFEMRCYETIKKHN